METHDENNSSNNNSDNNNDNINLNINNNRGHRHGDNQQQPQGRPTLSLQMGVVQSQPTLQAQAKAHMMEAPRSPIRDPHSAGAVRKRKGARSVSTLSAAQLERKRANDREAQRAIRARTKENTERLEALVKSNQHSISDMNRENFRLKNETRQLKCEVKHLREKHGDNEAYISYEPNRDQTPGRVGSTASSLFLSQPVTPCDTRPPLGYGMMGSGASHFCAPDDTSPGSSAYVTSIGDHGEWSSTLMQNSLQCNMPSPTSGGGNPATGVDGPSFMTNPGAGHGMENIAPILRSNQDQDMEFDEMGRADVGYVAGTSLSPSPRQTNSPYLHQPHPQHFNSAVSFGHTGSFPQPSGSQHIYHSGNYYSPVSRSPITM